MAAWTRYALEVVVLAAQGRLPWRPGVFLDWACNAGLLRLSGVAYQFGIASCRPGCVPSGNETPRTCRMKERQKSADESHNPSRPLWRPADYLQQSLNLHRQIGNRNGEAKTLNNFGIIEERLGPVS
jgi:hypothetical protein